MVYLNLDLLENVNKYLYLLFYYGFSNCSESREIYCSRTFKSVRIYYKFITYFDNLNKTYKVYGDCLVFKQYIKCRYTKNNSYYDGIIRSSKIQPFKISQEHLNYLRSSERLIKK